MKTRTQLIALALLVAGPIGSTFAQGADRPCPLSGGRPSQRAVVAQSPRSPAAAKPTKMMAMRPAQGDIIQTAVGPGMQTVTTLVKAVQAAELVDALRAEGPFTVFAPTNDAFAKLPEGTIEHLLQPENKEQLRSILLYHVHAGDAIASIDLQDGQLTTLNGKPINVNVDGPTVMVENATITKTDVIASNGVIHWLDTVILP